MVVLLTWTGRVDKGQRKGSVCVLNIGGGGQASDGT